MEVLVASTNVFRLELSAYLLAEAGYQVRECRNADGLLHALADPPPDLLLIDQQMLSPAADGPLRSLAQRLNVPLLVMVTKRPYAVAVNGHTDSYLAWPYQPADLLASVHAFHPKALG